METCDVLIVGGGLVGASLAIALDRSGLTVALAESAAPRVDAQPSYDERNLALAHAGVNALTALGVWKQLTSTGTPIRKIHISRQGEFGAVRLDAKKHRLDAFGAVVPARELGNALTRRLDACEGLRRFAPATVKTIEVDADGATAHLQTSDGEQTLRTRLLVGADGTTSFARDALDIGVDRFDYEQTAFVLTVTTERAIDSAYERFTATGPTALLPLGERRAGIVLTVPTNDAEHVANLDDAGFLELLHARFGWRLGRFSRPGKRVSYPLWRVCAQRLTSTRAVLIGNAAQTLHPIAAQGFNLGLRDALTLAERVQRVVDPGCESVLAEYAEARRADRDGTIAMSDGLARWTRDESLPIKLARSFGMIALDRIAPLQSMLIDRGMGFRGETPALATRSVP
jgi:2-octaprenyl-6-methoxyphenol hydroxylase